MKNTNLDLNYQVEVRSNSYDSKEYNAEIIYYEYMIKPSSEKTFQDILEECQQLIDNRQSVLSSDGQVYAVLRVYDFKQTSVYLLPSTIFKHKENLKELFTSISFDELDLINNYILYYKLQFITEQLQSQKYQLKNIPTSSLNLEDILPKYIGSFYLKDIDSVVAKRGDFAYVVDYKCTCILVDNNSKKSSSWVRIQADNDKIADISESMSQYVEILSGLKELSRQLSSQNNGLVADILKMNGEIKGLELKQNNDKNILEENLIRLQTTLTSHDSSLSNIINKLTIAVGDIKSHTSLLQSHSSSIEELEKLPPRMTNIESDVEHNITKINKTILDVNNINTTVSNITSDINNITARVSNNITNIKNIKTEVNNVTSNVSNINTKVIKIENDIDVLEKKSQQVSDVDGKLKVIKNYMFSFVPKQGDEALYKLAGRGAVEVTSKSPVFIFSNNDITYKIGKDQTIVNSSKYPINYQSHDDEDTYCLYPGEVSREYNNPCRKYKTKFVSTLKNSNTVLQYVSLNDKSKFGVYSNNFIGVVVVQDFEYGGDKICLVVRNSEDKIHLSDVEATQIYEFGPIIYVHNLSITKIQASINRRAYYVEKSGSIISIYFLGFNIKFKNFVILSIRLNDEDSNYDYNVDSTDVRMQIPTSMKVNTANNSLSAYNNFVYFLENRSTTDDTIILDNPGHFYLFPQLPDANRTGYRISLAGEVTPVKDYVKRENVFSYYDYYYPCSVVKLKEEGQNIRYMHYSSDCIKKEFVIPKTKEILPKNIIEATKNIIIYIDKEWKRVYSLVLYSHNSDNSVLLTSITESVNNNFVGVSFKIAPGVVKAGSFNRRLYTVIPRYYKNFTYAEKLNYIPYDYNKNLVVESVPHGVDDNITNKHLDKYLKYKLGSKIGGLNIENKYILKGSGVSTLMFHQVSNLRKVYSTGYTWYPRGGCRLEDKIDSIIFATVKEANNDLDAEDMEYATSEEEVDPKDLLDSSSPIYPFSEPFSYISDSYDQEKIRVIPLNSAVRVYKKMLVIYYADV